MEKAEKNVNLVHMPNVHANGGVVVRHIHRMQKQLLKWEEKIKITHEIKGRRIIIHLKLQLLMRNKTYKYFKAEKFPMNAGKGPLKQLSAICLY